MSGCRLCGGALGGAPRIRIEPAPSGAQHFAATAEEARARSITLEIVECDSCGLVQATCEPVDGYRRAITAAGVSAPMRAHRLAQAKRLAAGRGESGGRIALVGCGNGYELPILAEAGFTPEGIEFGGAPAGYSGSWPIRDGYPDESGLLPAAPYDAFACYNFLEHAPDPRGFLSAIAGSLAPEGCGVVEVPNYDRQRREGRAADYIADHLSYFDSRTFWGMLSASGFEVLSLNEVREGENLEAIVRAGADVEPLLEPAASSTIARDAKLLAHARAAMSARFREWREQGLPAVVWGASHQALTLLGGLKSDELPAAILDGASFKQGKFAPPSGLPVIAPSREALKNAGAVLVIASGYEREILAKLRGELGFAGDVMTMRGTELHRLD